MMIKERLGIFMKNYLELEIGLSSMVKKRVNKEFKEEIKKEVFVYFGFVSQRGEVYSKYPLVKS